MRLTPLAATGVLAILLMSTAPAAWAQDAAPDPHHPAAAADSTAPSPAPEAAPNVEAPSSARTGMPGGDMGMMQRMMACMMPGMAMPEGAMATPGTAASSPHSAGPMTAPGGRMDMMRGMMPDSAGMMAGSDPTDPVTAAFEAINRRMHRDMMPGEGMSPDRAFASAMIAHHQGAIDMAKVVIAFGADPEIRKLAEGIVAAQQQEILQMRTWLARQPG